MRNRFGKYIQDNHTHNDERQPDNSRDIQRLPQNEPADHRDKYNARARPDRVCDTHRDRASSKGQKEERSGVTRYYNERWPELAKTVARLQRGGCHNLTDNCDRKEKPWLHRGFLPFLLLGRGNNLRVMR
jgi:hypothetical protein